MREEVTYTFKDSKTYAIHNGKVIAASSDPDDVERQVKLAFGGPPEGMHGGGPTEMPPPPEELGMGQHGMEPRCANCDGTEEECARGGCGPGNFVPAGSVENPDPGNPMYDHLTPPGGDVLGPGHGGYEGYEGMDPEQRWGKVTTPNGLQGTVLGKVAGMWGDEVTIRLENGRIVKLPVGTEVRSVKTAATKRITPIEHLEARLANTTDGTRDNLVIRSQELEKIKKQASGLIREGISYADSIRLDQLVVTADVEQAEIVDAVAHIDDADSYTPPSFSMQAADRTSSVSREDASWLDLVLDDMIKTAEATDFTKLMDEGPEALTAELEDSAIADKEVTQGIASSFISEKTAGIVREVADPYMDIFLGRVEQCRRDQLSNRNQEATHKEAAVEKDEFKDFPDDALFL